MRSVLVSYQLAAKRDGALKVGKETAAALRLTGEFLRVSIGLHAVSRVTGLQQLRVNCAR